ncbi:hypothetical protein ACH5RR_039696 [Cinchona calisaya]|uniref:Uncharacterized protein n=1 Tax=Cinchona calisaya TaxID=153742 RepID=A0ABD2Y0B6_9GENT
MCMQVLKHKYITIMRFFCSDSCLLLLFSGSINISGVEVDLTFFTFILSANFYQTNWMAKVGRLWLFFLWLCTYPCFGVNFVVQCPGPPRCPFVPRWSFKQNVMFLAATLGLSL